MARSRINDFMQNHRFWLMDISPAKAFPFFVLGSPFLGFSSITMPEYTAETDEIKQVNSMFKKNVYSGGSVGPITLSRGVRGFDDSMWTWMKRAIMGTEVTNRNLLLIHFTSISETSSIVGGIAAAVSNPASLTSLSESGLPNDAWEGAAFVPGKVWMLWDCIPTRYKPGSDFEANGGEVSIAELEVQPWAMSEMTLLSPL